MSTHSPVLWWFLQRPAPDRGHLGWPPEEDPEQYSGYAAADEPDVARAGLTPEFHQEGALPPRTAKEPTSQLELWTFGCCLAVRPVAQKMEVWGEPQLRLHLACAPSSASVAQTSSY